jgi:hypothetical protein
MACVSPFALVYNKGAWPTLAAINAYIRQDEGCEGVIISCMEPWRSGIEYRGFALITCVAQDENTSDEFRRFAILLRLPRGDWNNCLRIGESPHPELGEICDLMFVPSMPNKLLGR